jgi:uncharacterized membrane protein
MKAVLKAITFSLLLVFTRHNVQSFPLAPVLTPEHAQALLPIGSIITDPALSPCRDALTNTLQLSAALLFTADGLRIASQLATNRTVTEAEDKAGTALSSIALGELSLIQSVLSLQSFKQWQQGGKLAPGARYYHALTTLGSGAGLLVICSGVASDNFWTTATGNVVVVLFFAAEAITTRWRDPALSWINKWQIVSGNIGGMLFAASSFVTYASQEAADGVLSAGLLVLSMALIPTTLVYFKTVLSILSKKIRGA